MLRRLLRKPFSKARPNEVLYALTQAERAQVETYQQIAEYAQGRIMVLLKGVIDREGLPPSSVYNPDTMDFRRARPTAPDAGMTTVVHPTLPPE